MPGGPGALGPGGPEALKPGGSDRKNSFIMGVLGTRAAQRIRLPNVSFCELLVSRLTKRKEGIDQSLGKDALLSTDLGEVVFSSPEGSKVANMSIVLGIFTMPDSPPANPPPCPILLIQISTDQSREQRWTRAASAGDEG